MRVATFNIQHCHDWVGNKIDIEFFADAIKRFDADFCGLNEVRGSGAIPGYTDQTNKLGDLLGCNRYFGEVIKVAGLGPYGNAFLTRYPILSSETVFIPDTDDRTDPSNYESRGVIKAVLEADGRRVCFMVCHMGLSAAEQRCAVETLCPMIDTTDIPLILMGDFNTRPDSGVLDPIFERMYDTDAVSENPGAFTYASYSPDRKIDYIFYKGLRCVRARTICEIISDHFPIIADFEF